ncbi:unnamed protein product [Cuscuta epithymum]|uniref:Uncharacterized protein n=1 Tax=Cuscuta epithymum TaxID=186058 RepID=A0AAV0CPB3_9ASTE|nr:unnamed protein product [Cuscuta epithymum]
MVGLDEPSVATSNKAVTVGEAHPLLILTDAHLIDATTAHRKYTTSSGDDEFNSDPPKVEAKVDTIVNSNLSYEDGPSEGLSVSHKFSIVTGISATEKVCPDGEGNCIFCI